MADRRVGTELQTFPREGALPDSATLGEHPAVQDHGKGVVEGQEPGGPARVISKRQRESVPQNPTEPSPNEALREAAPVGLARQVDTKRDGLIRDDTKQGAHAMVAGGLQNEQGSASTGHQLKSRYSELLLNLTIVASILAAFAYDAFESQTEIAKGKELERYFVAFCLLAVMANILAIIFSLFLWDRITSTENEKVHTFIRHYKPLLRSPRWMIMVGGLFFMILLFMQGHLDYGDYVDVEFSVVYSLAVVVAAIFFYFAKKAQKRFQEEVEGERASFQGVETKQLDQRKS